MAELRFRAIRFHRNTGEKVYTPWDTKEGARIMKAAWSRDLADNWFKIRIEREDDIQSIALTDLPCNAIDGAPCKNPIAKLPGIIKNELKGTVYGRDSKPLKAIKVRFAGKDYLTDYGGKYIIQDVFQSAYFQVNLLGYEPYKKLIDMPERGSITRNINLIPVVPPEPEPEPEPPAPEPEPEPDEGLSFVQRLMQINRVVQNPSLFAATALTEIIPEKWQRNIIDFLLPINLINKLLTGNSIFEGESGKIKWYHWIEIIPMGRLLKKGGKFSEFIISVGGEAKFAEKYGTDLLKGMDESAAGIDDLIQMGLKEDNLLKETLNAVHTSVIRGPEDAFAMIEKLPNDSKQIILKSIAGDPSVLAKIPEPQKLLFWKHVAEDAPMMLKAPPETKLLIYREIAGDYDTFAGLNDEAMKALLKVAEKTDEVWKPTIKHLSVSTIKNPKKMAPYFKTMGTDKFDDVIEKLEKTAAGRKAQSKLLDELYSRGMFDKVGRILVNPITISSLLVGSIGSYPFEGFLREEALQSIDFAVLTAVGMNDLEGMRGLLDYKGRLLERSLWEKILATIPYVNVLASLEEYYTAAMKKLEQDEKLYTKLKGELEELPGFIIINCNKPAEIFKYGARTEFKIGEAFIPLTEDSTFTVRAKGYTPASIQVHLVPGITTTYEVEFGDEDLIQKEKEDGTIELNFDPASDVKIEEKEYENVTRINFVGPPGKYNMVIRAEGYNSKTPWFDLVEGENYSKSFTLLPEYVEPEKPGLQKVIISCNVPADIESFGTDTGFKTGEEFEWAIQTTTFTMSAPGYTSKSLVAEIKEKDVNQFEIILDLEEVPPAEPTTGTVIIEANVPADIYSAEGYTGFKTPHTFVLEPATYDFVLKFPGYYDESAKAFVKAGGEYPIKLILNEKPTTEPYIPAELTWIEPYTDSYYFTEPTDPVYGVPSVETYYPSKKATPYVPPAYVDTKSLILDIETTGAMPNDSRIISISCKDASREDSEIISFYGDDEEKMVREFMTWFNASGFQELIGYNVSFDFRFIVVKCMKYLIPAGPLMHIKIDDMMQRMKQIKNSFVFGYNKSGSLEDWMIYFWGLKKTMTFEQLLEAYAAGRIAEVVHYNRMDVAVTYQLWTILRTIDTSAEIEVEVSPGEGVGSTTDGEVRRIICPKCMSENFIMEGQTSYECQICHENINV